MKPGQGAVLAEPLLQRVVLFRSPFREAKLLCLLLGLSFAVLLCSMPCTVAQAGFTTMMAWQPMTVARSLQFPLASNAFQFQQLAKAIQMRQPWKPSQQPFLSSVRGVPSPQSHTRYAEHYEDAEYNEDWIRECAEECEYAQDRVGSYRGVVKSWNYEKGFGFVAPTDGSAKKIYCHVTDLVDGQVDKGDEVSFDKWYDESQGKWQCHHVKVLHGDQRVGHDRKEGTIKSWDSNKGFGFVEPTGGGKKIFCHFRDLVSGNYGSTSSNELVGEKVTYEEEFNQKAGKAKCTEVSLVRDSIKA